MAPTDIYRHIGIERTRTSPGSRLQQANLHDEVAGVLQFAGDLLQAGRGYPGGRVLRVGLPHRLQQQTRLLNVTGDARGKFSTVECRGYVGGQLASSVGNHVLSSCFLRASKNVT